MRVSPFLFLLAALVIPAFTVHSGELSPTVAAGGKCGTPRILELLHQPGKIALTRPSMQTSVLSQAGHFRGHYDTTGTHAPGRTDLDLNGIPDYIDSTLAFMEYAWDLEVTTLGYHPPKGDNRVGGGDEIDIYIEELGNGNYGITFPDQESNGTSSAYIILDNDYTGSQYYSKGLDGLRVTTAHEFFHVIQFGYLLDFDQIWWMEQSATWMENRAWDGVNDYLNYLWYFFSKSHNPIDSTEGNFEYGAVLWPMYLAKRFGDSLIRQLWEAIAAAPAPGISCFDAVIPTGLSVALNEFGIWNYFTNKRANTESFYPDGNLFPYTVPVDLRKYDSSLDSLGIGNLSSSYAELLFVGNWGEGDGLKVDFGADEGLASGNSLIFFNTPQDFQIHHLDRSGLTLPLGKTWDRAVLISTCTNTVSAAGQFRFTAEWSNAWEVAEHPLSAFAVTGARPNPFNPATAIQFTLPREGLVSVKAYNIAGQKVGDIFEGVLSAGEKNILWKPSGLAGGVYFVTVTSGFGVRTAKVLLLK